MSAYQAAKAARPSAWTTATVSRESRVLTMGQEPRGVAATDRRTDRASDPSLAAIAPSFAGSESRGSSLGRHQLINGAGRGLTVVLVGSSYQRHRSRRPAVTLLALARELQTVPLTPAHRAPTRSRRSDQAWAAVSLRALNLPVDLVELLLICVDRGLNRLKPPHLLLRSLLQHSFVLGGLCSSH